MEKEKKEERKKEEMDYKKRYLAAVLTAIAIGAVVSLISWWVAIFPAILAFFIVSGIITIQEKHRAVIERFGKYEKKLSPGLNVLILPGIVEKIKETIYIEQKGDPIFVTPIKIDFKDGSASPEEGRVYTEINNPNTKYLTEEEEKLTDDEQEQKGIEPRTGTYRATYHIRNREEEIVKTVQNAVRSYLNGLLLEQGIEMALGGYNLLEEGRMPQDEVKKLQETFDDWGITLIAVRIGDFGLDADLVKARGERHKRFKEKQAASHVSERRAIETIGTVIQMMAQARGKDTKEIQKEIDTDEDVKSEFLRHSFDLIERRMAIDGKAYIDIRTPGTEKSGQGENIMEGIEKMLLRLVAAYIKMPGGTETAEKKETEGKKLFH